MSSEPSQASSPALSRSATSAKVSPSQRAELHLGEPRLDVDGLARAARRGSRRTPGCGVPARHTTASMPSAIGASQSAVVRTWARPSSLSPGLRLREPAGEPLGRGVRGDAVPDQHQRGRPAPGGPQPAASAAAPRPPRRPTRSSGSSTSAAPDRGDAAALAVERLVGQPVGVLVLLPRHPGVRRAERRQPVRLRRERPHVGVLDLPAARHLLDDELGVHPDLDVGVRGELLGQPEPGDQAGVLRDVVGGHADRGAVLGDHLAGVGVLQHRAVRRRAGVAARAAVGLDDDRGRGPVTATVTAPTRACAPGSAGTPRAGPPRRARPRGSRPARTGRARAGSRRTRGRAARRRRRRPSRRAAARRGRAGPRAARPRPGRARSAIVARARASSSAVLASRAAASAASRSSAAATWAVSESSSRWASSSRAITSSSSSSRVVIRRCSDSSSPCIRSRSLGLADQPLVHPVLVALAPGLDLLDVRVDLGLLGGQVVDRRSGRRGAGRRGRRGVAVERGDLGQLGQGLALVAQLVGARVELLEVQQGELGGGVGFQRSSPDVVRRMQSTGRCRSC